ncbi:hypothetical protein ACLKA7_017702 [Drosophila subpalustris]
MKEVSDADVVNFLVHEVFFKFGVPERKIIESTYLPEVEVSIRHAVHTATVTPFFAVFGQHMYLNGTSYKLARMLRSLSDHEICDLEAKDRLARLGGLVQQPQHLKHAGEHVSQQQELYPTIAAALSGGHLIPQPGQQLSPASSSTEQRQRQNRLR